MDVQSAASEGVAGSGSSLPYLDTIQGSFGRHDVSGVQAHTGSQAAYAAKNIGAKAYATGNDVAFAGSPNLHTAAHEAAHVVQQRGGVSLKGGVGEAGDRYEQHADAVADAVVQGKSAESILDKMAGNAAAVQQKKKVQRKKNPVQRTPPSTDDASSTDAYAAPGAVAVTGAYDFYEGRHGDFLNRYMAANLTPPTYYLGYGGKYNLRFINELRPRMTSAGQAWLDGTSGALQQGIEDERSTNPEGFDCLEKDDPAFTAFAYGTHADAYLYAGLKDLNPFDLAMIGTTPDVQDLLTQAGLSQAVETGLRLLPYWGENLGLIDQNTAYLIDRLVRSGRPDIEDVVGIAHAITDANVVQPMVNYIDGHLGPGATALIANEARERLQDGAEEARTWVETGLQQLGIPVPW